MEPEDRTTFSLALHSMVVEKLFMDPTPVINVAIQNIPTLRARTNGLERDHLEAWNAALEEEDVPRLIMMCMEKGVSGDSRRKISPFAGVLSVDERLSVIKSVREKTFTLAP